MSVEIRLRSPQRKMFHTYTKSGKHTLCDNLYCIEILIFCDTYEFIFSLGVYVELTWYKLKQALSFCLIIYDH